MVDMSSEAIAKRKEERRKERELAESVWNTMMNEGDEHEKEYWIKGYCVRMGTEEISDEEIEEAAMETIDYVYLNPNDSLIFHQGWMRAIKWYREQLKSKQ